MPSDIQSMNHLLERIGVPTRVHPGDQGYPTFYILFAHILDRLDAMERLREEVRYPDGDPNNL